MQDTNNILGISPEEWAKLSKKDKRQAKFKVLKRNILPALLGGSLGSALFSKDKEFKKLGVAVTAIGVTAGLAGFDPTKFANVFKTAKANGLNKIDLAKTLTQDQKNAFSTLGNQNEIKSSLSFTGNDAKILTAQNEDYLLSYDNLPDLSNKVIDFKGVPNSLKDKILKVVSKEKNTGKIKKFLSNLWGAVKVNVPNIIASMQNAGLETTPEIESDTWGGVPNDETDEPTDKTPKETTNTKQILGIDQNLVLGGAGVLLLGYVAFKK